MPNLIANPVLVDSFLKRNDKIGEQEQQFVTSFDNPYSSLLL